MDSNSTTTTINDNDKIFSQINVTELIIVITCGLVLILTTLYNNQPSETIIGIFGGYLGASYKNAALARRTTTTTNNPKYDSGELPKQKPIDTSNGKKTIFTDET